MLEAGISFSKETTASMILYDMSVKNVQQWSVTDSKEHHKVLQIPAGVYFMKVTTDEGFSDYKKVIFI